VFVLDIGFDKVPGIEGDGDGKPFAVQIIDTVLIQDGSAPEILTANAKSSYEDVHVDWKNDDEEGEEDKQEAEKDKLATNLIEESSIARGQRAAKKGAATSSNAQDPEDRRKHQEELKQKAEEEMRQRLVEKASGSTAVLTKDPKCFKTADAMDGTKTEELRIFVDRAHDAVVFPICGMAVPFHISTLKTFNKTDEGDGVTLLRVNFDVPPVKLKPEHTKRGNQLTYVKELAYRTNRGSDLAAVHQKMKDLQKRYREQLRDAKEREDYVEQAKLIMNKRGSSNIRLTDLVMRPSITQGKRKNITGTLEAHANGFLFTNKKGEKFELLYKRIKHSFYQGPEDDMTILLHFRLDPPLMIQKKKYTDIQFYTEVGEAVTDLGKTRGGYDGDEMESEQRERRRKKQLKKAFKEFMKQVQDHTEKQHDNDEDIPMINFETPQRALGFMGAPLVAQGENVLCAPTLNCLVNLAWRDKGAFVLSIDEIERIHCERVDFALKNFDLVVIYKDYTRNVDTIRSIPRNQLESIKEWLNEVDVPYTESPRALEWKKILKHILSDIEGFLEDGGWTFLEDNAAADEEEGMQTDESEGFEPDESELEEESDDESEYSDEDSAESDYSGSEAEDDEESEGLDWEDMENDAKNEDKRNAQKEAERDRDEAKGAKRKRPSGKSSSSSKSSSSGKKKSKR